MRFQSVITTKYFKLDYKKLPPDLQERFLKQLKLLLNNPRHPSLRIKKIKGTNGIFEGRVSQSCRFTFCVWERNLILRRIGEHDKTLKKP